MNAEQRPVLHAKPAYRTERIIASLVMAWVIMLTSYMIFQDKALSEASMYFLKILLSLSGAVMLATLPGFLDINYGVGGLSIRAAGGAAAFVFIYTQSPNLPVLKSTVAPYAPAQSVRPAPTSSLRGYDRDSLPLLVALSLDPFSIAPATAVQTVSIAEPAGQGQVMIAPEDADTPHADMSAASASVVNAVASTVYRIAREAIIGAARQAMAFLDRIAAAVRAAGAWMGEKAADLIAGLRSLTATPAAEFAQFVADVPERADAMVNTALAPAVSAIGALTAQLGGISYLSGGVGETVRAVPQLLTSTVSTVTGAVGSLTSTLGETLATTTKTVEDLVTGVLHSPKDTVALTSAAAGDLTQGLIHTTQGALATAKNLTQGVGAQLTAVTNTLNDIAPALVAKINPGFDAHVSAANTLRGAAADYTALPPLAGVPTLNGLKLPQAALPVGRVAERFDRSEEIHGGCASCLLPPLDIGPLARAGGPDGGPLGLGGRSSSGALGGIASAGLAYSGGNPAASGGGALGNAAPGIGGEPAGSGPASGLVNSLHSNVGGAVRGVLGRH
jgi:hypothetical protein